MRDDLHGTEVVRSFSDRLSTDGTFSLALLRAIDGTIDSLSTITKVLRQNSDIGSEMLPKVEACRFGDELDPDKLIVGNLHQAAGKIETLKENLSGGLRSAQTAAELESHRDDVVQPFEETIAAASELIEIIEQLCSLVEKHDAELDHLVGPFDDADALIAALRS